MFQGTLVVFLLVIFHLTLCLGKHARPPLTRHQVTRDTSKPINSPAETRALKKLPSLTKLLSSAEMIDGGVKFDYNGCEIKVTGKGTEYDLDLSSPQCQGSVSLKSLYTSLVEKAPDAGTTKFTSLDNIQVNKVKFSRNTKDVSFEAKTKSPIKLIGSLEVSGNVEMNFNYKAGNAKTTFKTIGMKVEGDVKIGSTTVKYTLEKTPNSPEGKFTLEGNKIVLSDFYKAVNNKQELDTTTVADKKFTSAAIDNPTVRGSRDEAGNSELIVSASSANIPGFEKGSILVIVNQQFEKSAIVGVLVELSNVNPAAILSKLITKINLKEVPVFSKININVVIEYANGDVTPKDDGAVTILNEVSETATITKGIKMKFKVPFEAVLKQYNIPKPPSTQLDQYVTVMMTNGKVSFDFPPNALMDTINIAIAFVPNLTPDALKKVFTTPPTVKFHKFEIDVKGKGSVDIELEASGGGNSNIGYKFLSVNSFTVKIKYEGNGWDFSIHSNKMIGTGNVELNLKKVDQDYMLIGTVDKLWTGEIADTFEVDSKVKTALKAFKSLNMALSGVNIQVDWGSKFGIKFVGKISFLKWETDFEGYVVETSSNVKSIMFGIVLKNFDIAGIVQEMMEKEGQAKLNILEQKWMSRVITSIIFSNKAATDALEFVDENLKNAKKPADIGVAICADILIPKDCKKEVICEFVKKKIGADQHLILSGTFTKSGVELEFKFNGNISIANGKYNIHNAGFRLTAFVGKTPEFGIYGEMIMNVANQTGITFKAKIGLSATLTATLALEMDGEMKKPFGYSHATLGPLSLSFGINLVTALPNFCLGGKFKIGTTRVIEAEIMGALDTATMTTLLYAKFSSLTLKKILESLDVPPARINKIPKALSETGFTDAVTAGFASPTAQKVNNDVTLEPGFFLKGKLNLLGLLGIQLEISVKVPSIKASAKLDPITLAKGSIKLTSYDQKNEGPEFELALGTNEFILQISAYVEVLGIGLGTKLSITPATFSFDIKGKLFDYVQITASLVAPFKPNIKDVTAKEWKVEGCLETEFNKIAEEAGGEIQDVGKESTTSEADSKKASKSAKTWYEKAVKKMESARKSLTEYEASFKKAIDKQTQKKIDTNAKSKKCVAACAKKLVWFGGMVEGQCLIKQKEYIACPKWNAKDFQAIDPGCLEKCKTGFFKTANGWWKGKKFKTINAAMGYFSALLTKLHIFLVSSKQILDSAQSAATSLGQVASTGKTLLTKAASYVAKNIISIKTVCVKSYIDKGVCLSIDADFTIFKQPVKLDQEEVCFRDTWLKDLAKTIAKKAVPGLDAIKDHLKAAKDFLTGAKTKEAGMKKEENDLTAAENAAKKKRTLEETTGDDSEFADILPPPPEIVLRDDDTMRQFRDTFFAFDRTTRANSTVTEPNTATMMSLNIDPVALSGTDDAGRCKRTKAVMDIYSGVSDGINELLKNNQAAKNGYLTFTDDLFKKFDSVDKDLRLYAHQNNMSDFDTSELLFYTTYTKQGISNMRSAFESQFNALDKSSLKQWREVVGASAAEKNLDMASFVKLLNTASQETAKKWSVPAARESEMQRNMDYAKQAVQNILTGDDTGLSTKESSIAKLGDVVKNLVTLNKDSKCLQ